MKAKVLYKEAAPGQTFDWLTVKETEKSYIVMTKGKVERELRFHKTSKMEQDIEYLKRTEDGPWFYHCYIESGDVHPYWRHERMIY